MRSVHSGLGYSRGELRPYGDSNKEDAGVSRHIGLAPPLVLLAVGERVDEWSRRTLTLSTSPPDRSVADPPQSTTTWTCEDEAEEDEELVWLTTELEELVWFTTELEEDEPEEEVEEEMASSE